MSNAAKYFDILVTNFIVLPIIVSIVQQNYFSDLAKFLDSSVFKIALQCDARKHTIASKKQGEANNRIVEGRGRSFPERSYCNSPQVGDDNAIK